MAQLPVSTFLKARLKEFDPNFELRSGTGFESLFFKPIQFIVQPLRDEAFDVFTSQSLLRILLTDNPDAYNEDDVDDMVANQFVFRRQGGQSSGVGRVYYNSPVDREFAASGAVFTGSNGLTYSNPSPFSILSSEMELNLEEGLYYFDIPVQSETAGADTTLGVDELISLAGDEDVVRVTNKLPIEGGLDREKNTELITRTQQSIGVRDLVAGKGFRAILFENFQNSLLEAQPIGFGDGEMMRDIVYNTHIGGRVDGWVKTSKITAGSKDFVGVLTDMTRQAYASSNIALYGTAWAFAGNKSIDRTNNKNPSLKEIKPSYSAQYTTTVNFSGPINLATNQHIKIGIDGVFLTIRIAGVIPSATTRNEVVNLINAAFGFNVATGIGNYIRIKSPTQGLASQVVIDNPDTGNSAIALVFGLSSGGAPYAFNGDGPVTYIEGVHYNVDQEDGEFQRIIGPLVLGAQSTGETTADSYDFVDPSTDIFLNVQERDIITIQSGADAGDYRVLEKINNNYVVLDKKLTQNSTVNYLITRSGIKSGELVYAEYYYNPLSIDIGGNVALDQYGRVRGVRPGREAFTITDLPLLRVVSIEEIDPLTKEPTGFVLDGSGGYGQGGYGIGAYGVGTGAQWRMVVNIPEHRFSMFEDAFIVLNGGLEGLSFRVNYEYVPEIGDYHNFVRSASERVLDGDILMKHFIPAYVSMNIKFNVDASNSTAPSDTALLAMIKDFINKIPSSKELQSSDIIQFITRTLDPYDRYDSYIEPFVMSATIHNTNGTTSIIKSSSKLIIPTNTPIYTTKPLSPRTSHWIADNITLERV